MLPVRGQIWMSIMPKRFREKVKGTLIWTESKQSFNVSILPEGIYEKNDCLHIYLSGSLVHDEDIKLGMSL